jgi:hypothetical protein
MKEREKMLSEKELLEVIIDVVEDMNWRLENFDEKDITEEIRANIREVVKVIYYEVGCTRSLLLVEYKNFVYNIKNEYEDNSWTLKVVKTI